MLVLGTVMKAVIYFLRRIIPVDRMSGVTVTERNEMEEIGVNSGLDLLYWNAPQFCLYFCRFHLKTFLEHYVEISYHLKSLKMSTGISKHHYFHANGGTLVLELTFKSGLFYKQKKTTVIPSLKTITNRRPNHRAAGI